METYWLIAITVANLVILVRVLLEQSAQALWMHVLQQNLKAFLSHYQQTLKQIQELSPQQQKDGCINTESLMPKYASTALDIAQKSGD